MSVRPSPDITVDVNLRNPAHVFACCGLLELVGRLPSPDANARLSLPRGWFATDEDGTTFNIATGSGRNDPLGEVAEALCAEGDLARLAPGHERHADDRKPIILRAPFDLRLDWWLENYSPGWDKSELKVWAGNKTPHSNLTELRDLWRALLRGAERRGADRGLLSARESGSGIGIDPGGSWTAINMGFSPDAQNMRVLVAPATEILAMIGLQRCRPVLDDRQRRRWFIYHAWADPVPAPVAAAALAGVGRSIGAFTFPVEMRNAQYGNFGWAKPWESRQ